VTIVASLPRHDLHRGDPRLLKSRKARNLVFAERRRRAASMFALITALFAGSEAGRRPELEVVALRHQLAVLRRQRPGRPKLTSMDRLLSESGSRGISSLRLRTIRISTRHLFTFIRARHEIVSAFVWVPPATVRDGYYEVDANTLRGHQNLP
jgi:hypothetical protein